MKQKIKAEFFKEYVNITDMKPVSYTHLDVYKRQAMT